MRLRSLAIALLLAVAPVAALAQAYGQGSYNTVAYGTGQFQLGPITLPDTGATWVGFATIALAITGQVFLIYRRAHRARHLTEGGVGSGVSGGTVQ